MSRLSTLLLSGPAPPDTVAVWFEDLPLDAPLECCYGPSNHPRAMGLWFPKLAADAKLQIIGWPGASRPMHGDLAGDGPGLAGERVHGGRAAQGPALAVVGSGPGKSRRSWRRCLVCPRGGTPASRFAAAAPALACGANA